jgi:hypothetical protein
VEVVCGMAAGADACGYAWAIMKGIPVRKFPADWNTFGRSAGMRRNRQMAESGISHLIVFNGGYGTQNMVNECLRVGGIRIIDLRDESLLKDWHTSQANPQRTDVQGGERL